MEAADDSTALAGFNGASGIDYISAYTKTGCGVDCAGGYDISLSGARYSNAPEPGELALTGAGLNILGFIRRLRR